MQKKYLFIIIIIFSMNSWNIFDDCDHFKWRKRFLNEIINKTDFHSSILTKSN